MIKIKGSTHTFISFLAVLLFGVVMAVPQLAGAQSTELQQAIVHADDPAAFGADLDDELWLIFDGPLDSGQDLNDAVVHFDGGVTELQCEWTPVRCEISDDTFIVGVESLYSEPRNLDGTGVESFSGLVDASSNPVVAPSPPILIEVAGGADLSLAIDGPLMLGLMEEGLYEVSLANTGDADTLENVEVQFAIARTGIDAADVVVNYCEDSASAGAPGDCNWLPLTLTDEGGVLTGRFGPSGGFPVPEGYDATTYIQASFSASGNYDVQASAVGMDSDDVLASDMLDVAVPSLVFDFEAGVPAGVDDSAEGFAYYTADLLNDGDELPEPVRMFIEVRDSEGLIVDDAYSFEFWNSTTETWDSLAYDPSDERWAFGPASGFVVDENYVASTPVRADFPNDLYDLTVTVETADQNADPIWVYGLFEEQLEVITEIVPMPEARIVEGSTTVTDVLFSSSDGQATLTLNFMLDEDGYITGQAESDLDAQNPGTGGDPAVGYHGVWGNRPDETVTHVRWPWFEGELSEWREEGISPYVPVADYDGTGWQPSVPSLGEWVIRWYAGDPDNGGVLVAVESLEVVVVDESVQIQPLPAARLSEGSTTVTDVAYSDMDGEVTLTLNFLLDANGYITGQAADDLDAQNPGPSGDPASGYHGVWGDRPDATVTHVRWPWFEGELAQWREEGISPYMPIAEYDGTGWQPNVPAYGEWLIEWYVGDPNDGGLRVGAETLEIVVIDNSQFQDELDVSLVGFESEYQRGAMESGSEEVVFDYTANAGDIEQVFNVFRVYEGGVEIDASTYAAIFESIEFVPNQIRGLSGTDASVVTAPGDLDVVSVQFLLSENAPLGDYEIEITSYDVTGIDPNNVALGDTDTYRVLDTAEQAMSLIQGPVIELAIDGPLMLGLMEEGLYEVSLANTGDADTPENVEVQFAIARTGIDAADVVVNYCEDSASAGAPGDCNWLPLTLTDEGGVLTGRFGPSGGFPVPEGYDATTFIQASFSASGNYDVQASAVGMDSDDVLASDMLDVAVPSLVFDIEAGVPAGVDDSAEGFAYYTADLLNVGDDLPEPVRMFIEVRDSEGFIVDDAYSFEFWNSATETWDSLAYDPSDERWAFGPASGFVVDENYVASTPVRADFPNDLYDLTVTVETADQSAGPVWVYGLFEEQIEVVTSPEGAVAAQINGADADGQSLTIGDAFDLSLSASDVLPRSGKELFVVFDGQRPSDGSPQPGEGICEDLLGLSDCALLADSIGFDHPVDAGDSTLFDDAVSIRPDAETGTWTLNFFLVEAVDDGSGGSEPGQVVDTLSVELTIDEATVALDGLGTETLTVEFSTDVIAGSGIYAGLDPADIAAQATDTTGKQAFLDEFFQLWISVDGVPTPVDAADLDAFGTDWDKVIVDGTSDSLSVTFEAGIIVLDFSLDQGNTGATRIDVEWTGTADFETAAGGQPLDGPDAADNPFKVEFDVDYDLVTGPDYGPATATFIDRTTPLQRPFATGIQFGATTTEPVAIEFDQAGDVSATVSLNGGSPQPYNSGEVLTAAGDYNVLVTNDGNPGIVGGAQTSVQFTIELATVTLSGLDTSTLTATFSEEVISTATGYAGLTPDQVADEANIDPASKETFLLTFFDFDPAELALIEDWDAVSVAGTDTELSVNFAPGLFDKTFALDQGNTGASRIDAAWDGTDEFETLSGQPLDGPAESAFKLEFTVPYDDTTGVDYTAAVTTTFIDAAKPIIRPFAPGIESDTTTTDPVAIDFAVGSYATGLVAEYSLDGDTPVAYNSGEQLTEAGFYELTVTNDSNPNVEPNASTTIRFTIESELAISIDGPTLAPVMEEQFYEVRLQNLLSTEPSENVLGQVIVDRAAGIAVGDVVVDYCADSEAAGTPENCATWLPLNLVDDGGVLTATYGPGAGFPVEPDYDATTFFRVSFVTAGNYDVVVNALGADSDSVLASDAISIAATELVFDIDAGVDPAVPDEEEGWAYYTATLVNLGDALPENVLLWVDVDGIGQAEFDAGANMQWYNEATESWTDFGWGDHPDLDATAQREAFFLGRDGAGNVSGFPVGDNEDFPTPIRVNFDNDTYDFTTSVENVAGTWVFGQFEDQVGVISDPVDLSFELDRGVSAPVQPPRWDYFTATLSNTDGGATPDNVVLYVEVDGTDFAAGDQLEFWNGSEWQDFGWDSDRQAWFLGRDGAGGVTGFPIDADEVFPIELRVNFLPDEYDFTVSVESIDDEIIGVGGVYAVFAETAEVLPTEATITFVADDLVQTFDGSAKTVGVITSPEADLDVDITFDPEPPVDAGSYVVDAVITDPYFVGSATTSLLIEKGQADLTLSDLSQVFDGDPKPVTVDTDPTGLMVNITYDGQTDAPDQVGSYSVFASIDDPNWTDSTAGLLQITPATADVTLLDLQQTFDGTPREVTADTDPAGLDVIITYDGSPNAPISAGSYAIEATVDDNNYVGSAAGTLVVDPATADVLISDLDQVYDGEPKPVTVTTDPAGLAVEVTYDGDTAVPVDAGSYAVVATIVESDYTGSAGDTLDIQPGDQTIDFPALADRTVDDSPFTLSATASSGLAVSFDLISGPATLDGDEVTLTGDLGEVIIEAQQDGDDNWNAAPPVQQSFQVTAGQAEGMEAESDVDITGQAGEAVDAGDLPTVRVFDSADNPVAGVTVSFELTSGDGSISGATQVTDSDGLAQLGSWTLGGDATQTVEASAPGLSGSPITFTATVDALADVQVSIDDNRDTIEVGERNTYVLAITNAGPSSVTGATVQVDLPPELDAATAEWSCFPALGATCSADGVGDINDTVDLPVDSSLVYILEADVLMGPTQTIEVEASVQMPADVDPTDPAGISDSAITQVIITEDGIFQDRFEDEADEKVVNGQQVQGILELPAQVRHLHPVQPLIIGRDAAGRSVFRAVLAGAEDQQWVRLSKRDTHGGWTHSTWQALATDDRVLAFEFDAELGVYILVGEDFTLELPLTRTAHPVSSIDTADRVDLMLNQ